MLAISFLIGYSLLQALWHNYAKLYFSRSYLIKSYQFLDPISQNISGTNTFLGIAGKNYKNSDTEPYWVILPGKNLLSKGKKKGYYLNVNVERKSSIGFWDKHAEMQQSLIS